MTGIVRSHVFHYILSVLLELKIKREKKDQITESRQSISKVPSNPEIL